MHPVQFFSNEIKRRLVEVETPELEKVQADFAKKLGLPTRTSLEKIVASIWNRFTPLHPQSANNKDFNLASILASNQIIPCEDVYIYWDQRNGFNKVRLEDLSRDFKDIWCPLPSDIMLFDESYSWALYIASNGVPSLARF